MPRSGTLRSATSGAAMKQRAVAAEHDQQIDRRQLLFLDRARAVRRRIVIADDDRLVAARTQPRGHLIGDLDRFRLRPLEQKTNATHACSLIHFG